MWAEISPSVAPTVVVRKDHPGGYKLELEIPLAIIGAPTSDVGVALAMINDFGTCTSGVCDGYGVSIPSSLPVTNADNPATGCMGSWIVPDDWGTGYFATSPANVWISRSPVWWNSRDIEAFACDSTTPDYTYYPDAPCGLRLEATLHNDSSSDQERNLVFLWGEHTAGVREFFFIDLQEKITIPPGEHAFSSAVWNGVPPGLLSHPCVRAYVLPPTYEAAFDRADILAINSAADLANMVSVYGIADPQWAQKNIAIHSTGNICPDEECQIGKLFDGQEPPPQRASVRERASNSPPMGPSASLFRNRPVWTLPVLTALITSLVAWSLVAALTRRQEAARQRISRSRLNWRQILWGSLMVIGLIAPFVLASCIPIEEPPSPERPTPTPEPEVEDIILLPKRDTELFGRDNVMVQVRSFGYSKPLDEDPPRYNFIESLGGVLQLFSTKMIEERGEVPFEVDLTNPGEVVRTVYLRVDVHIPASVEPESLGIKIRTPSVVSQRPRPSRIDPKGLMIEIETEPEVFKPGETRAVEGVIYLR
jgi:hypothetical protein